MKWLIVFSMLMAVSAEGNEAGSPALGDNIFESKSLARMLPVDEEEEEKLLDQSNTAPTPIPEDTSLIINPEPDLLRQAQEEQFDFEKDREKEDKADQGYSE